MRTKIKNQLKGLGIVFMVIGMVVVGLGLHAKNRQAALDAQGVTEPAEITRAAIEAGAKSNKRYILTVQWGEPQARQTKKFEVKKDNFMARVDGAGKLITASTTVRLLPGQPDTALLEGAAFPFAGVQGIGYAVILFGAFLFFLGFRMSADPAS